MDLCNEPCLSGRTPFVAKALMLDIASTFQPTFFMTGMSIGTTDVYLSRPFSLTLTLTGGHKVSAKAKPLCFMLAHTFKLIKKTFIMVLKQFKLDSLILLLSET